METQVVRQIGALISTSSFEGKEVHFFGGSFMSPILQRVDIVQVLDSKAIGHPLPPWSPAC
jgi:hypothetical protein